ncbi:MAG TPA: RNA polymerase sigma factor, partial [Polyangia bacterium]
MNAQIPLSELVTHAGWLRRLATGLLRDPDAAEDVVQATLVAAWRNPPSADRDVRPWLAEVARNQAHDQRRGDGRRRTREAVGQELAEGAGSGAVSPESLIGDLEIHRQVAEVVTGLDEPYRSTVVLHYYEGLDTPAVAARLGVAAGTIRWRLKEGLDRIRVELDRRHGGDRKRWQLALLPLVPLSALEKAVPAGAATAKGAASGTRVALWVSGGLVAAMLVVMASRGGGRQPDDSARTAVARPTGERERPAFREGARVP